MFLILLLHCKVPLSSGNEHCINLHIVWYYFIASYYRTCLILNFMYLCVFKCRSCSLVCKFVQQAFDLLYEIATRESDQYFPIDVNLLFGQYIYTYTTVYSVELAYISLSHRITAYTYSSPVGLYIIIYGIYLFCFYKYI